MSLTVVLCRRTFDFSSGAGRLAHAQAEGLRRAGLRTELHSRRGRLKFFISTGRWPKRTSDEGLARLAASRRHLLVDHGMCAPAADVVFVHNVLADAARYLLYRNWAVDLSAERLYFAGLNADVVTVANSELARQGLIWEFGFEPGRVRVVHPGFSAARFNRTLRAPMRTEARRKLRLLESTPLVGFVTSGDFQKRGLDVFLDSATRIAAANPAARFLVVGSKRLPSWAAEHPLVRTGRLLYRPKSSHPEPWFAALDIFLYPARYEEFGLVVTEALALGLPVLTSRRVGAAECLPPDYTPWLLEAPDAARFAELTLNLLEDPAQRARLGTAGAEAVAAFDEKRYVRETVALILEQARIKSGETQ